MTQPPRNLPAADREHINDTLYALTVQIARTLCADDPTERDVHLAVLAAAHLVHTELDAHLDQAAHRAARCGADYAEIGDAVGITRQGARRRWPGLALLTRSARRH